MATLTEFSFPFDAVMSGGKYDRTYVADDFARYFRAFISSGIFMDASTNLQIIANGDMTVSLKSGKAIINGYRYELTEDANIILEPADGTLNRIDRVAITWDKANREISYTIRQGQGSASPIPPECRRTEDVIDFVVGDIYVTAGAISISQANITDTRLDTEICGVATPFYPVDTTTIFNQFEAWFLEYQENGVKQIEDLIAELHALVDGDAVARLQSEIDKNADDISTLNENLTSIEVVFINDNWVASTDNTNYGYEQTVSATLYGNRVGSNLVPNDDSAFFSDDEEEAKGLINPNFVYSNGSLKAYASDIPKCNLKFIVGGTM